MSDVHGWHSVDFFSIYIYIFFFKCIKRKTSFFLCSANSLPASLSYKTSNFPLTKIFPLFFLPFQKDLGDLSLYTISRDIKSCFFPYCLVWPFPAFKDLLIL